MDPERLGSALYWIKVLVGGLLATNFALPLYTVVSNRELWDEPMALLAGNLSGICMVIGLMVMLVGMYDLTQLNVDSLCRLLHYNSLSLFVASKVTHVCLALDQFVAVTRPLHYYQTMERACPWLIAII